MSVQDTAVSQEELAAHYQTGNEEAAEVLYKSVEKLIYKYANKFPNTEQQELVSIGNYCFFKAIDTFDKNKGFKFTTYFGRIMYNEMLTFVKKIKCTLQLRWI